MLSLLTSMKLTYAWYHSIFSRKARNCGGAYINFINFLVKKGGLFGDGEFIERRV